MQNTVNYRLLSLQNQAVVMNKHDSVVANTHKRLWVVTVVPKMMVVNTIVTLNACLDWYIEPGCTFRWIR